MSSANIHFVAINFRKDRKCRFQVSDPLSVTHFTSGLYFQKNFKHTSAISHAYKLKLLFFTVSMDALIF